MFGILGGAPSLNSTFRISIIPQDTSIDTGPLYPTHRQLQSHETAPVSARLDRNEVTWIETSKGVMGVEEAVMMEGIAGRAEGRSQTMDHPWCNG